MYRFSSDADNDLWDALIAADDHYFEVRARINNIYYGQDVLMDMATELLVFSDDGPGIGGCIAGQLTLKMRTPAETIPRMAKVEPYVRVCTETQSSAWMPQGKYWIDTRETTDNDDGFPVLTLTCYDAMLKAEQIFPSISGSWPRSDVDVVKIIAKYMGLQGSVYATTGIDQRSLDAMDKGYQISLPASYTLREVLSYIAVAYAGNWIMNYDGQLLLVTLGGIPAETSLLVDESGNIITFGEDAISIVDTTSV